MNNVEQIRIVHINDLINELTDIETDIESILADMGIDASPETMTIGQMIDRKKVFRFNDPIQRGHVWNMAKRSLQIVSILENVSIGHISVQIIRENKQKIRNVIDGKQRSLSPITFVENKWALSDETYVTGYINGEKVKIDISGLYFKDLPEVFQRKILGYNMELKCYEIDDEMKNILFYRWNQSEPLKPAEKRKSLMSPELLITESNICNTAVFKSGLSESAINRNEHGDAVIKAMYLIMKDNDTGFQQTEIDKHIKDRTLDNYIPIITQVSDVLNYSYNALNESQQQKMFSKAKTISLSYVAHLAINKGVSVELFTEWLRQFIDNKYDTCGITAYLRSSTTKKSYIKERTNILVNDFESFLEVLGYNSEQKILQEVI